MATKDTNDLTAEEAAALRGISVSTFYRRARISHLQRKRLLGRFVYPRADVEAMPIGPIEVEGHLAKA
ncbi:MAG: hypothetical protein NT062_17975 [Proteobacteria bacterium]|nr:hypothetical protein [Pseudomonadota bacterium]